MGTLNRNNGDNRTNYSLKITCEEKSKRIEEVISDYESKKAIDIIADIVKYYDLLIPEFSWDLNNVSEYYSYSGYEIIGYDDDVIKLDLIALRAKLSAIRDVGFNLDIINKNRKKGTTLNMSQNQKTDVNVEINIDFNEMIASLESNTGLSLRDLEELKKAMFEVKNVSVSNTTPNEKWRKIKQIADIVMDKSIDAVITCMPYILSVLAKMH